MTTFALLSMGILLLLLAALVYIAANVSDSKSDSPSWVHETRTPKTRPVDPDDPDCPFSVVEDDDSPPE